MWCGADWEEGAVTEVVWMVRMSLVVQSMTSFMWRDRLSVCERLTINNITSTFTLFGMDTYTHASIGLEASRSHPASHCITLHHTDDCRWTEVVKDCTKIIYDDGSTHLYPSSLLQAILDPSRLWLGVLTCARASVPTHPSHPFRADAPFQCSS